MTSSQFAPLRSVVLVEVIPPPENYGDIAVRYERLDHNCQATIVSTGPEIKNDLHPGDVVFYSKHYGHELVFDDGVFIAIAESDLLGVCAKS